MSAIFLITIVVLCIWVFGLSLQVKKLQKDSDDLIRGSAYLETVIKDVQILAFNPEKGKNGEWEINQKLKNLLK